MKKTLSQEELSKKRAVKREYDIGYRAKNKEKLKLQQKNWMEEKIKRGEIVRIRRNETDKEKQIEKRKVNAQRWKDNNREKVRAAAKDRYNRKKHKWRENDYKRKFGITVEDYSTMFVNQGGCCAICKTTETGKRREYFAVDHDHKTGKVRGLLCSGCNTGIGHFEDDVVLLFKAIEYLNKMNS